MADQRMMQKAMLQAEAVARAARKAILSGVCPCPVTSKQICIASGRRQAEVMVVRSKDVMRMRVDFFVPKKALPNSPILQQPANVTTRVGTTNPAELALLAPEMNVNANRATMAAHLKTKVRLVRWTRGDRQKPRREETKTAPNKALTRIIESPKPKAKTRMSIQTLRPMAESATVSMGQRESCRSSR